MNKLALVYHKMHLQKRANWLDFRAYEIITGRRAGSHVQAYKLMRRARKIEATKAGLGWS
jgi:hypothetical protein